MSNFPKDTQAAVTQATAWADESVKLWLGAYVDMVDRAADGKGKPADDLAKDLRTLSLAAQRDAARVMNTWINLGTALVNLQIK
jgi:hypothetical protein